VAAEVTRVQLLPLTTLRDLAGTSRLQNPEVRTIFGCSLQQNGGLRLMKTLSINRPRQLPLIALRLFTPVLLVVSCWTAPAQEGNTNANAAAAVAKPHSGTATNQPSAAVISPGVAEVLKMADAGVSTEVIKTYVESSPVAAQPTDDDVIAMKKHNVGDDVVTLLLKRGAEARGKATAAKNEAVAQVLANRRAASGGFEPESYDYFRYYYLQPRALASANQRLYPYYSPYFSRPHGYGPVYGYGYGAPVSGRPYYRGLR